MKDPTHLESIVVMTFREFLFLACSILMLSLTVSAKDLPSGTILEARLSSATGSRLSHRGDSIEATIIAPVSVQGRIIVPQGSRLLGSITDATAIGLGLKHSTASITYGFNTLQLPGGAIIPLNTELVEVDTAKEHVDDLGTVHGIHPVASLSSGFACYGVPLLLLDPTVGAPLWGMKSFIAPSANPEIHFPAGTELILRLLSAVSIPAPSTEFPLPAKSFSREDLAEIEQLLQNSAQRAYVGTRPSDIVNMLFIGTRVQMDRAFHASGWSQANRKSPISLYRMYLALAKRYGYPKAPMALLTLNGGPSAFVEQKSLDTVQKRHHVRFWPYPRREGIWLGAAVEDIGFRFEVTHWTHSTDPGIDSERAKIVNDLAFAGCLDAAALLPRASADLARDPKAEYPIVTDGDIAVIRLNDCIRPNVMAGVDERYGLQQRGRASRALIALRDDLIRSNIFFTTYNTFRSLTKHSAESTATHTRLVSGESHRLDWLVPLRSSSSNESSGFESEHSVAIGGP